MPKTFFRSGFGWPAADQLRAGMNGISGALRAWRRPPPK